MAIDANWIWSLILRSLYTALEMADPFDGDLHEVFQIGGYKLYYLTPAKNSRDRRAVGHSSLWASPRQDESKFADEDAVLHLPARTCIST